MTYLDGRTARELGGRLDAAAAGTTNPLVTAAVAAVRGVFNGADPSRACCELVELGRVAHQQHPPTPEVDLYIAATFLGLGLLALSWGQPATQALDLARQHLDASQQPQGPS